MQGEEQVQPPTLDDRDEPGTTSRGVERDEGVGELSPLPDDAGGDTPPDRDTLADLEKATGRSLSDDLTAEATQPAPDKQPDSRPDLGSAP